MTLAQAIGNFVKAVDKGLLKIMSKMGISTVDSYCGAQIFEALGIGEDLLDVAFAGTPSVVGGIGFDSVAAGCAWPGITRPIRQTDAASPVRLETWGMYQAATWRRTHEWNPQVVQALHAVARAETRAESLGKYRDYSALVDAR